VNGIDPDDPLRDSLRDLIPDYRGPADPFLRVRASIRHRRSRRRAWLTVGSAAAAAALAALAPAVLTRVGSAPTGNALRPAAPPAPAHTTTVTLPTEPPAAPAALPPVYPVAHGTVGRLSWAVGSTSLSPRDRRCLYADDDLFSRTAVCFDAWQSGGELTWSAQLIRRAGAAAVTAVFGVAPQPTTEVAVLLADGSEWRAPAVATATDPDARFFALVVSGRATVRSVRPFDSRGRALGPPVTAPLQTACTPGPDRACADVAPSPR